MSAIVQGSTIGILGGGQLGRMTAMAARSLGYRVQVMDPDPSCPARFVVDACFVGSWDDARAAADLARGCDVITLEIEQISIASLEAAARHAPVRPGKDILAHPAEELVARPRLPSWPLPDHPLGSRSSAGSGGLRRPDLSQARPWRLRRQGAGEA
jgi:5-(carboxyamino)imidazole ribonucleotide synthase